MGSVGGGSDEVGDAQEHRPIKKTKLEKGRLGSSKSLPVEQVEHAVIVLLRQVNDLLRLAIVVKDLKDRIVMIDPLHLQVLEVLERQDALRNLFKLKLSVYCNTYLLESVIEPVESMHHKVLE